MYAFYDSAGCVSDRPEMKRLCEILDLQVLHGNDVLGDYVQDITEQDWL